MSNQKYLKNLHGKKKKENLFLLNLWLKIEMIGEIEKELRVHSSSGKPMVILR